VEESFPTLEFYTEEFSQGHILSIRIKESDSCFYEFSQSSNLFEKKEFRKQIMTEIKSFLSQKLPPKSKSKSKTNESQATVKTSDNSQTASINAFITNYYPKPALVSHTPTLSTPTAVPPASCHHSSPATSSTTSHSQVSALVPVSCHSSPAHSQALASLSQSFPYTLFTGEDYVANEQILREKFKAGVESCIGTLGQNKLLALESIFCFLLNGKLDFKGYMEILEEASNTVRVEHLNFVKSKFQKDPVTKRLNDAEYFAEVDKTYKFMNSHVREMCCNNTTKKKMKRPAKIEKKTIS